MAERDKKKILTVAIEGKWPPWMEGNFSGFTFIVCTTTRCVLLWHSSEVITPFLRCRNRFVCCPIGFIGEIREVTFLPNEISVEGLTLVERLLCCWAEVNLTLQWVSALQTMWQLQSLCPGSEEVMSRNAGESSTFLRSAGPSLLASGEAVLERRSRQPQACGFRGLEAARVWDGLVTAVA